MKKNKKLATKNWSWIDAFDKKFTRVSKGGENDGQYMREWFVREEITSKDVKQFIDDLLVKILAEMESAPDARACRHILKDYILGEK